MTMWDWLDRHPVLTWAMVIGGFVLSLPAMLLVAHAIDVWAARGRRS